MTAFVALLVIVGGFELVGHQIQRMQVGDGWLEHRRWTTTRIDVADVERIAAPTWVGGRYDIVVITAHRSLRLAVGDLCQHPECAPALSRFIDEARARGAVVEPAVWDRLAEAAVA